MSAQLPELSEPGSGVTAPTVDDAPRRGTWRAFLRRPLGVAAAAILLLIVAATVLAPLLAPRSPSTADLGSAFGDPTAGHPLGFDSAGRDVLSRLLYGGRTTLGGAVLAVAVALVLGVPTGLVAGYRGRRFDAVTSWLTNLVMALPAMVVLLASRAILGPTVWVLMVVMGVLVAPSFYRLTRGVVADVRGELYVDAARVAGLSDARIVGRHVLVVVRAPIVIQAALVAGVAIGLQAGLEFLGIGSGDSPTWGAMLNEAFQNIQRDPGLMLWPGLALGLTSASLVLVASGLRDALEGGGTRTARPSNRRRAPAGSEQGARPAPAAGRAGPRGDLLSVRNLTVVYGPDDAPTEVTRGVDLDVGPGEILGLVGESGSGKTQTAFSVLGILPEGGRIAHGSVTVEGREVLGLPERERRRLRGRVVAYVPQEPMSNLDPAFTVGSQLVEPLRCLLGLARREARARAVELLRQVEIKDPERVMGLYPHEISGGMAQRVLIAGALSCDPRLLVADEPTTALDVTVQAEVLDLLRHVQAQRGLGVLLVTHNLGVVADLCDRVAVMQDGRIVETGTTEQILTRPEHPYTRTLLAAVLDDTPAREEWTPPAAPPAPGTNADRTEVTA